MSPYIREYARLPILGRMHISLYEGVCTSPYIREFARLSILGSLHVSLY